MDQRTGWKMTRALIMGALIWMTGCTSEPAECTRGTDGCPCESGSVCDDGLVCESNTCRAPREVTLRVDDADARACEVLLHDGDAHVASVRFEGVAGAHVREAPRTALSFAGGDGAIPGGAVRVQVVGDGDAFTVERARCFDSSGHELASTVRIDG